MQKLSESIRKIIEADSRENAGEAIETAFRDAGFDRVCIAIDKRDRTEFMEAPDINTFGDDFRSDYMESRMVTCDVVAIKATQMHQPFWYDVTEKSDLPGASRFFGFLASHEIAGGLIVPLKSTRGLTSGVALSAAGLSGKNRNITAAGSALAHVAMIKLELIHAGTLSAENVHELVALTAQQHDLLKWAAEGKSNTDIATITGLSRRGVDYHMGQIFKKLGVNSKAQAVALLSKSSLLRR